ncbi:MAG: site-specific DNA-methyltransferase [Armatimonadetes bacterium]|nr:site-specific DNA-methyltransferase [Armatimonadota bacterium]
MPYLQFKGKTAIETYHHAVPHHSLEFVPELSILAEGEQPSLEGNLIIEGDNILALKALLPTHAGRIKCIYIDPPYNTGNEKWVYNDNLTQPQFKEWIGQTVGKEGEDATRHDKWCCMMYPRLQLLKELLHPEGVILVSIDDNEAPNLRLIMDEVFDYSNFIAQLVWEKGRKNDAKLFSVGHEYMVVYAKSKETLRKLGTVWREPKPGAQEIWDHYVELRRKHGDDDVAMEDDLRLWYSALPGNHPSKALARYRHVDRWGPWRDRDISWPGGGGPRYDVPHPKTLQPCRVPERGWGFATSAKMQQQIDLGLVVFREDHTEPPFRKAHLRPIPDELDEDTDAPVAEDEEGDEGNGAVGMQVMPSVIYKQSQVAVKHLRNMMGTKVFENPKDHEVLTRVIGYCTAPGDIILDSFAGSGTTGHAVLQLNHDPGSNRRFILVQLRHDTKDQQAKGQNICASITRERIRRAIAGYAYTTEKRNRVRVEGLGGSFAYARLSDKPLFGEYRDLGDALPAYEDLARYVFYTETSRQWDTSGIDRASGRIGEHAGASYYLLYEPSQQEDRGLDIDFLKRVAAEDRNTRLVVYHEKLWIHRDDLRRWESETGKALRAMQIPFHLR